MAKRPVSAFFVLLLSSLCVCAQETADSTSATSVATTYPALYESAIEYADRLALLDYESVLEEIAEKRAKAKRRRKTLPELDPVETECKRCLQMLKASDQVLILDSVVVDKNDLLSAYGFGGEVGTIKMSEDCQTTEFVTERGNMSYRPMVAKGDSTERLRLVSSYIENGRYVETRQLQGFDMDGDVNYPFMMSDGVTFYFASRAKDGLGNYDLYATRYDFGARAGDSEAARRAFDIGIVLIRKLLDPAAVSEKAGSEVLPLGCGDHALCSNVVVVVVGAEVLPDVVGSVADVGQAKGFPDKSGLGHWGSSFRSWRKETAGQWMVFPSLRPAAYAASKAARMVQTACSWKSSSSE